MILNFTIFSKLLTILLRFFLISPKQSYFLGKHKKCKASEEEYSFITLTSGANDIKL
jgi:hypothetical protein